MLKKLRSAVAWKTALTLIIAGSLLGTFVFAQGPGSLSPSSSALYFVRGLMTRFMPVDSYQAVADVNSRGDVMVAQSLPERTELVRLGNTWSVQDTTAVADLTGAPTTTASSTFWNGEPDGGKSYVVDRAFCTAAVSAGAASAHTLFGMVNKGPVAAPSGVSLTISTHKGRNYPGKIVVGRSVTVTNDGWFALPDAANAAGAVAGTTTIGLTIESNLKGLVIIPPRHQFSLAVMAVNATETNKCGLTWHEVQL